MAREGVAGLDVKAVSRAMEFSLDSKVAVPRSCLAGFVLFVSISISCFVYIVFLNF